MWLRFSASICHNLLSVTEFVIIYPSRMSDTAFKVLRNLRNIYG